MKRLKIILKYLKNLFNPADPDLPDHGQPLGQFVPIVSLAEEFSRAVVDFNQALDSYNQCRPELEEVCFYELKTQEARLNYLIRASRRGVVN
jgi:hypothetical protein